MSSITEQQNQPPVAGRRTRATTDWRDDDLALLRKQWRAGASARQIVEAFGGRFTRNAVIGKANRLGLSRHDKPRTPAPGRKDGYPCLAFHLRGARIRLPVHLVVWALRTGAWPEKQLDHRDTDRANSTFSNLRTATHGQNNQNTGPKRNNKTGVKGVAPKRSRFTARIMADGVDHYLGTFDTTEAAGAAYKAAARSLHGEFARTEK